MTTVSFAMSDAGIPTLYRAGPEVAFDDLCDRLFASMPRSDQRRTGADYLRGLLQARGRTSMRGLAALPGVSANEQSLHHFISSSSWSWDPVRRALAEYLMLTLLPKAWVIHPFPVARSARSSGIARRLGHVGTPPSGPPQAFGVWAATEAASAPVSWRLPGSASGENLSRTLIEAALEPVRDWGMPPLPTLLDAREANPAQVINALRMHGMPALVRIEEGLAVYGGPTVGPALQNKPTTAGTLADMARNLRRPVGWRPQGAAGAPRTSLVWAGRVQVPGFHQDPGLLLVSVTERGAGRPTQLWLTDLADARVDALFRLTALAARVDRDSDRIGDGVGLRDFAGRSPEGWHRHATLASAAYAVTELNRLARARSQTNPVVPGRTPAGAHRARTVRSLA